MKVIFYCKLLGKEYSDLTPNQKIVYSHILSKSVLYDSDLFNKDGDGVDWDIVADYYSDNGITTLDLVPINITLTARLLNMSRQSLIDAIKELKGAGMMSDSEIYTNTGLLNGGFFQLRIDTGLSKMLLIIYSWLFCRAEKYNFIIDTYERVIAEKLEITANAVGKLIKKLADKGFVKRLRNPDGSYGKLQINHI